MYGHFLKHWIHHLLYAGIYWISLFRRLKLELAVVIDAGEPFVTRTYLLEGDGELATLAYDLLQEVSTACGLEDYPQLEAVTNDLADGNDALKRQMTTMAKQCVRPAKAYSVKSSATLTAHCNEPSSCSRL